MKNVDEMPTQQVLVETIVIKDRFEMMVRSLVMNTILFWVNLYVFMANLKQQLEFFQGVAMDHNRLFFKGK